MKTTSSALTDSSMRFATVVFPDPVPPEMPIIKLTIHLYDATMNATHHTPQQLRKRVAHAIARGDHFFMIDRLVADARGHVCNTRDAEHFNAHVARHNRLRNRTHPHRISAEVSQQVNLRRSFITRTGQCPIY